MPKTAGAVVSVIVPARNEARNLETLIDEIHTALGARDHEILIVDDGSTDDTGEVIKTKRKQGVPARHLRHARSLGQSAAIRTGVWAARGETVVTLDGDGQNDPAYIPQLLDALAAAGPNAGLAMGQRKRRTDGTIKKLASRFANGLRRALLDDEAQDSGCGLKAAPTDVFRRLPYFDGWHRFIPALVSREGRKLVWIDVIDRSRGHGRSNYGIFDRGLRGILDLFGAWWLKRRYRGPAETIEVD
jgi:glycosyltransferase involved in cell wall biosynthesis